MKIAFSSAPQGHPGDSDYKQIGDTQPNGTVTWGPTAGNTVPTNPQTVLSVQPDGSYQTRDAGTAGPWEVLKFDGSSLTIRPNTGSFDGPTVGYVISARALP